MKFYDKSMDPLDFKIYIGAHKIYTQLQARDAV